MFKKMKNLKGIALIEEIASRFEDMAKELDQGVDDCQLEQECNDTTIDRLQRRNTTLGLGANKGDTIAKHLRDLIS